MGPELEQVFAYLDQDGTGDINLVDLARLASNAGGLGQEISDEVKFLLQPETLSDMYACFDTDSSGRVNRDEFVQGSLAVLTRDIPIELTQLLLLVRNNSRQLTMVREKLEELEDELT